MMDFAASEKNFAILVAVAAFIVFWALWTAATWEAPIEGRLRALRTRRVKTRTDQPVVSKPSSRATSLGVLRTLADRMNLLRGAAADQTTRKLRQAGFLSRDASVVYVFAKLALPLALGFLMIILTSVTDILDVPDDLIAPVCVLQVLSATPVQPSDWPNLMYRQLCALSSIKSGLR